MQLQQFFATGSGRLTPFFGGDLSKKVVTTYINWLGTENQLRGVDPYLVWMDITSEAPTDAGSGTALVNVLIELAPNFFQRPEVPVQLQNVFPTHFRYLWPKKHRFVSLRLPVSDLKGLLELVRSPDPLVHRFEIVAARNGNSGDFDKRFSSDAKSLFNLPAELKSKGVMGLFRKSDPNRADSASVSCATSARPVPVACAPKAQSDIVPPWVGIIDDGCNFGAFLTSSRDEYRVRNIWHQGSDLSGSDYKNMSKVTLPFDLTDEYGFDGGWVWQKPEAPVSGKIGGAATKLRGSAFGLRLETLALKSASFAQLAEPELYRRIQYLYPTMSWTHGAAMLDLILRPQSVMAAGGARTSHDVNAVFVQLPEPAVEDTSGGSLVARALDGIHDILDTAAGPDPDHPMQPPVVVNLSYGTHSGPHDGTSMFESALKELLNKNTNLHVVLPAGNSHVLRGHASGWLNGSRKSRTLRWKILPDSPTDSFLEIWVYEAITPTISVKSPSGASTDVESGQAFVLSAGQAYLVADKQVHQPTDTDTKFDQTQSLEAAAIYPQSVAQGLYGTMFLLAVAPTRNQTEPRISAINGAKRVPLAAAHGVWEVTLTSPNGQPIRYEAWIQRDDVAPGSRRARRAAVGRQSYFLDDDADGPNPHTTLNGIATACHDRLWVVGSSRASDGAISTLSASGPNARCPERLDGPDAVVFADQSKNSPGISVAGVLGASRRRVSGTSVAAARFSRMLIDHLAQGKSSDCFVWPHPSGSAKVDRVPAGAPREAEPLSRGEHNRMQEARDASQRGAPQSNLAADAKLPPDR